MERVTREGLAEKFALQLYAEEAARWHNKVSVYPGEAYPTPAEISRGAVERADALIDALYPKVTVGVASPVWPRVVNSTLVCPRCGSNDLLPLRGGEAWNRQLRPY